MPGPIEDYALVGDRHTAALVGRDGSIDWLCLPRFDSSACFAALLGDERHGRWLIGPVDEAEVDAPLPGSHGAARDHLHDRDRQRDPARGDADRRRPRRPGPPGHRRLRVGADAARVGGALRLRPGAAVGQAASTSTARRSSSRSPAPTSSCCAAPGSRGPSTVATRTSSTSARARCSPSRPPGRPRGRSCRPRWAGRTGSRPRRQEQAAWADRCSPGLPHLDLVVRSLVTLRMLTLVETGGMVAAADHGLPEDFGGGRNWDYRYCWLRDAALTLERCSTPASPRRRVSWRAWLLRAVAGDPQDLQIMYAVDGSRELTERELDHLPGYAGSRPVRVGNGAVTQRQSDVLGEVMIALDRARDEADHRGPAHLVAAALAGRGPRRPLGGARPRALGGPRPATPLHPLPRHGVGGLRPGRPRGGAARARGARRAVARAARRGTSRGAGRGASTATAGPSPSTTTPARSTPACW